MRIGEVLTLNKEYVEREVISEGIRKYYYKNPPNSSYEEGFDCGLDKAQRVILNAPAADVAEVRHGRWIEQEKYTFGVMYDCSICDNRILDNGHSWNYCPNCGAKMDKEKA